MSMLVNTLCFQEFEERNLHGRQLRCHHQPNSLPVGMGDNDCRSDTDLTPRQNSSRAW